MLKKIKEKGNYLFDGAFGTYYANLYEDDAPCEMANLTHPERVLHVHENYCKAGCDAIKTNTFSANEQTLECGKEQLTEILKQGYWLACRAASSYGVDVFADIGPLAQQKDLSLFEQYKEIVDIFLDVGAKYFLFETFYNDLEVKAIAKYIKSICPDSFIIISFALSADGYTRQGISGEKLLSDMDLCDDIDAIGLNCICGPMHLDRILKKLNKKKHLISIMPNSGYPTLVHNRTFFRDNRTYYAQQMLKILSDGATIIGGCCGTTPHYIHEIRKALSSFEIKEKTQEEPILQTQMKTDRDPLHEKLARKEKIIAVEFDPPNNCDIEKFMENAEYLKAQGIDAITIADCPVARARVDSCLLASKLHRELGMGVIPHMTCRDRNINATKALLFGLQIEGIHNVLVVTGDPIPAEDRKQIKGVFNFNSQLLAGFIHDLNQTTFPQPFMICGALNINAVNFEAELNKAKRKEEQGVTTFMTQPVLSKTALDNLKKAKKTLKGKLLGGIIPIVSYRNAIYMDNEISGIDVDDKIIALYEGKTREEAGNLAVSISNAIVDEIYDDVDGYYFITPFNRVDIIGAIIAHVQEKL